MLKKVIPIVIALCIIAGVTVMAENENMPEGDSAPEISEQIPQNIEELPKDSENMDIPPSGGMQGRTPPNMPNGEMPREGMNRGQRPQGNFTPPENMGEFIPPQGEFNPPQNNQENNTEAIVPQTDGNESTENPKVFDDSQQFGGQMPENMGGFPGNMQNGQNTAEEEPMGFLGFVRTYSTPITSVILLGLAFIFVIFYRRKNY